MKDHVFIGVQPIEWNSQLPKKFRFQNQNIGMIFGEPWEDEAYARILVRVAVFKPNEVEGEEGDSEQVESGS